MDILKYKGYEGTAELDMARSVCRGKILFIDDLVTYEAATPGHLQAEFEAAVNDYLETCAELKREPQKALCGTFNVRIDPALHRAAKLRSITDGTSLNDVVGMAIDCYVNGSAEITKHNFVLLSDDRSRHEPWKAFISEGVQGSVSRVQ